MHTIFMSGRHPLPNTAALYAAGRAPMTYDALIAQIGTVRDSLWSMGIERGDCVAVAMPNGPERLVVQLGVMECCALAPISSALRAGEIERQLTHLNARAVVVAPGTDVHGMTTPCLLAEHALDAPAGAVRISGTPVAGRTAGAQERGPDDIVLLMQTSGTTAKPKIVPLTIANIQASAMNISGALALGPDDRFLSLLQLHHIAGVAFPIATFSTGGSIFCTPGFDADSFYMSAEMADPTWFWAAPAMLHDMVRRSAGNPALLRAPRLRFIKVGSAPLPARLMQEAEQLFHVPVLESYGMTEAAPQITSVPLPPRVRKPGSAGVAAGTEIMIVNERGESVPQGITGEIVIRGRSVTSGYRSVASSDGSAFFRDWLRTGDLGYIDADGYLFLTGRLKEIINRGGEKVSPIEIDSALLTHPDVEQAASYPVPHPTLGEEIATAIVLRAGSSVDVRDLQKFAIGLLPVEKVPRYIHIVRDIPCDERGKIRRLELANRFGNGAAVKESAQHGHEVQSPHTPVERELIVMWEDVLRLENGSVGTEAHFLDLGGDSVSAAQIISRVRRTFSVDLSPLTFFEAPTIAGLARVIESKRGAGPVQVPG